MSERPGYLNYTAGNITMNSLLNAIEMEERADVRLDLLAILSKLYGDDIKSPGWECRDIIRFPHHYRWRGRCEDPLDQVNLFHKIQYFLTFRAHFSLLARIGSDASVAFVLFRPNSASSCEAAKTNAAIIRKHCIWPRFGSVMAFITSFEQYHGKVKFYGYDLHPSTQKLSLIECKAIVEKQGDEFGAKLADLIRFCDGDDDNFLSYSSDLISLYLYDQE